MRRSFAIIAMLALVLGAVAANPAQAAKKKKAKPVATTYYLHGQAPYGEMDGAGWFADGSPPESPMTVDATKPEGSTKSMAIQSLTWNSECTGLPLGFPTFTGKLAGTITGDATLTMFFSGQPQAGAIARIWTDVGAFQACNEEYIAPASEVTFDAAAGENKVVFEDLKLPATSSIMIEVLVAGRAAPVTRLQYDSPDAMSSLAFQCIPPPGATSCAPPAE